MESNRPFQRSAFLTASWVTCAACLAFLATNISAGPIVPFGSIWKYLDDGSNQSNAWRSIDFEDDGWSSGPAQLGYGDGDEATEISYGTNALNKYITTYFRHTFNIDDVTEYTNLVLNVLYDDGAVVYLNGVEVYRANMPGGTITFSTLASTNGENKLTSTTVSASRLVNGLNILAVEVHQDAGDSSDLSFDLELTDGRNDTPIVSIVTPANNSVVAGPDDLAVVVSATDPNGTITNVQWFAGNTLMGSKSQPPFTFLWPNVPPGAHIISATARDNDGLLTASAPIRFVVGSGGPSNLIIIPQGTIWHYLDNGSNQGTAWRGTNFNDTGWKIGLAEFGYGDGDEATIVSYGTNSANRYITTYFRREFVITDLAQIRTLVLRLLRDDGAVVYINSNEVFRSNMPSGTIGYQTTASSTLDPPAESTFVRTNLSVASLRAGQNVIAVEIHQRSASSPDLSFDLELLGSDLPNVLRGPWLQSVSWSNAIVRWRTETSVRGRVLFGTNATNLNFSVTESSAVAEHTLRLTNLAPGRKYFYSLGLTNGTLLSGPDFYFITPPRPGTRQKMRFWALGDSGTANVDQLNVRDAFYRMNGATDLDAILLLGDNAYNAGTDAEYQKALFETYPAVLRKTPLWSTIGNHETDQSSSPSSSIPYYQIFTHPLSGEVGGIASGTKDYYSFDYGNIHFVCLDSMTSSRAANGTMANWLRIDLQATTQDWLIAYWHHPPYSRGNHNSDNESELIEMRQNLLPILENYGVDLVLCGHSHAYERTHLLDGHYGNSTTLTPSMKRDIGGGRPAGNGAYVKPDGLDAHQGAVYVVTGSAGKITGGSLDHPAMFLSLNRLGSLHFEVASNRLDAVFLRETGATNDTFTIIKGNSINVADVSVVEPDTNNVNVVFTLSLARTSSVPVTFSYATAPESATSGVDFEARSGAITFDPGTRTQTVTVPIIGDLLVEPDETFALQFSGSPLLTRSLARGFILDNDSGVTNSAPPFAASVIAYTNSSLSLRWQTVPGRTYRVEYKDDLNAPDWQVFGQIISGDGTVYTFADNPTNAPQRFYRINLQ